MLYVVAVALLVLNVVVVDLLVVIEVVLFTGPHRLIFHNLRPPPS